jgi:hypothetical protein
MPKDPANKKWTKKRERAMLEGKPDPKTTIPGGVIGLARMNGVARSPVPSNKTLRSKIAQDAIGSPGARALLLSPSTPSKNAHSSKIRTDKGTFRSRILYTTKTGSKGAVHTLESTNSPARQLQLPETVPATAKENQLPQASFGAQSATVTLESYKKVKQQHADRKACGEQTRKPSNNDVMRNRALVVGQKLKLNIQQNDLHWIHLLPHSLFGNNVQKADNIGLGTKHGNVEMEFVNSLIPKLLEHTDAPKDLSITITATPSYISDEEMRNHSRLLEIIDYCIEDNHGHKITFHFNMLNQNKLPDNFGIYYEKIIKANFDYSAPEPSEKYDCSPPPKRRRL